MIVGSVDTPGYCVGCERCERLRLRGGLRQNGLQVIDISTPTAPVIVGSVDTPET